MMKTTVATLSTGHLLYVQDKPFILLNRTNRTISLFRFDQIGGEPLDKINLANLEVEEGNDDPDIPPGSALSSAHHITRSPKESEKVYFASSGIEPIFELPMLDCSH